MTEFKSQQQPGAPAARPEGGGTRMQGRVLIVAGSDSGGGAGIQADIKAVTALGGYAMTAVTALTAQNTEGVSGVVETPPGFIGKQMRLVLTDIGADVIKIGMVPNEPSIESVHYTYMEFAPDVPLVLDPVMVAKGGHPLIDRDAIHMVRQHFLLHCLIATPNIPEAEVLTGMEIHSVDDMKHAAEVMITLGCQRTLIKGGHFKKGDSDMVYDVLFDENGIEVFEDSRVDTPHTHGTGCTLASALAVSLAQGMTLRDSVIRARAYVRQAILTAPGFGKGHGPLNHAHTVSPFHPERES
jgi:hydroxymethylpyrimidine/phosphomethylpyrimidine kinase